MQNEAKGGMWLLLIYSILVLAGIGASIGILFLLEPYAPDYSGMVFIVCIFGALIGGWPLALRLTSTPENP